MQLKPHQEENAQKALQILTFSPFVYIAGEVRTGKTLTALRTAGFLTQEDVLFVTKLKAMPGVQSSYNDLVSDYGVKYRLTLINHDSLHKVEKKPYKVVICDEHHACGAFPKPSKRAKELRELIPQDALVIFLSGTPHPESWSQLYHQFWVLGERSPWSAYPNFYKWAKEYVNVKQRKINGYMINDYSQGIEKRIWPEVSHLFLTISQSDAGIEQKTKEHIVHVPMLPSTYRLVEILLSDKLYKMRNGQVILCDKPVKLQSKLHQIFSGTVKDEEGNQYIIDRSKAEYIKKHFEGKRMAIFYKFDAEGQLLREVFPNNTSAYKEFTDNPELTFICQIVSGREGTDLSHADCLIMYNIDFSATSYFQARDRMVNLNRQGEINLYWIFSEPSNSVQIGDFPSMEALVYDAVSNKKNYTLRYFEKDFMKKKSRQTKIYANQL